MSDNPNSTFVMLQRKHQLHYYSVALFLPSLPQYITMNSPRTNKHRDLQNIYNCVLPTQHSGNVTSMYHINVIVNKQIPLIGRNADCNNSLRAYLLKSMCQQTANTEQTNIPIHATISAVSICKEVVI